MLFYDFLGNEQLKDRLSGMIRQDKSSHCYLISGPDGSGKHTLFRLQVEQGSFPGRGCQ